MSEYESNRPAVLINDEYAESVCTAFESSAAELRTQLELVEAQIFALSATGDGLDLWEKYLGIYNSDDSETAGAVIRHLRAESEFTRSAVAAVIESVVGSKPYTLTEGVNSVTIEFTSKTTEEELNNVGTKLNKIKPAHLTLVMSISSGTSAE